MKLKRDELKEILKECLMELIRDGHLNDTLRKLSEQSMPMPQQQQMMLAPQQPTDPNLRLLAMQSARNQTEAMMMERAFADTANSTLAIQMSSDPEAALRGGYNPGYAQPIHVPQAQPLFPQQPQGYYPAAQPQQQQQPNDGYASNWARLAFNSPIKNRPSSDSVMAGLGGGSAGFLPGMGQGRF